MQLKGVKTSFWVRHRFTLRTLKTLLKLIKSVSYIINLSFSVIFAFAYLLSLFVHTENKNHCIYKRAIHGYYIYAHGI